MCIGGWLGSVAWRGAGVAVVAGEDNVASAVKLLPLRIHVVEGSGST